MKVYVEFLERSGLSAPGSDGVSVLDGRLSLFRLEAEAEEQAQRWARFHGSRRLGGWRIRRAIDGRFDDRNPVMAERIYGRGLSVSVADFIDGETILGGAR